MKKITYFILTTFILLNVSGCIKNNITPLTNEGKDYLELREFHNHQIFLTPFIGSKRITLFSVQRNFTSNAKLNSTSSISIKVLPNLLTRYNNENNTAFELFPDSLYTLSSKVVKNATDFTLNFSSQDYISSFDINLNGSKFNLSKKYALPVVLTTSNGLNFFTVNSNHADTLQSTDTVIAFISIKNKYDATYVANGYLYHPVSPRAIKNLPKSVLTAGPNSVIVDLGDLGNSNYKALIFIDENTNKLTISTAPGAAGDTYTMFTDGLPSANPGYTPQWNNSTLCNNTYDPATKTFYLRYGYLGSSGWRITEEILVRK